jgi:hypothetical protein
MAKSQSHRTTKEVFEDHLQKRLAGDLEDDIRNNYAADVVMLTHRGVFRGAEGVRNCAAELARSLGGSDYRYDKKLIDGGFAYLVWRGFNGDKHVCDGADSYAIREGKIIMQTIHYTVKES